MRIVITDTAFSPDDELAAFAAARGGGVGAIASFAGYCRSNAGDNAVTALELQHYPGFTEREIDRLARDVAARHALDDLVVVHRIGAIEAQAPIVFVAARSAHRAAAFAAVSEMMDYLKTDAPFWKREVSADGARWVEPTEADYARRQEHQK